MGRAVTTTSTHCPFVNRSDPRCERHLKVTDLSHAFAHCFGRAEGCPVYVELTFERRVRRARAGAVAAAMEVPGHATALTAAAAVVVVTA